MYASSGLQLPAVVYKYLPGIFLMYWSRQEGSHLVKHVQRSFAYHGFEYMHLKWCIPCNQVLHQVFHDTIKVLSMDWASVKWPWAACGHPSRLTCLEQGKSVTTRLCW